MKKITTLSLVAVLALGTSVYAESIEEALGAIKVKGEAKVQYFNVKPVSDGAKSDTILVGGGNINLTTGVVNGFKAGLTFQTSSVLNKDTKGTTNNFAATMDASGAVMSEAYLEYMINNTSIKAGRQYITTKLVAGSGSRMIKQSFQGVVITNTDIKDTTLVLANVSKFQGRTDSAGDVAEFNKYEDGANTLYVKNSSVENLTIQAQYLAISAAAVNSDKTVMYLDGAYKLPAVKIEAQYMGSSNDSDTNKDASLMGIRASGNIGTVNLTGIYTATGSKGKVYPGAGGGADGSFSALPLHGGGITYEPKTDTTVFIAATNVKGVTLVGYYGVNNTDTSVGLPYKEVIATGGFVQYGFSKNLSAKVMYESAKFNHLSDPDDVFRVYTSYKF